MPVRAVPDSQRRDTRRWSSWEWRRPSASIGGSTPRSTAFSERRSSRRRSCALPGVFPWALHRASAADVGEPGTRQSWVFWRSTVTAPVVDLDSKKSGRIMASGVKSVNANQLMANQIMTVAGLSLEGSWPRRLIVPAAPVTPGKRLPGDEAPPSWRNWGVPPRPEGSPRDTGPGKFSDSERNIFRPNLSWGRIGAERGPCE
ncbi:hypothetical protein SAMN05443249_0197 [Beijerinckia sp. 28-YEA-48]|nr:hypothetical protein SAMN05443249_0197 [Beijerinckia sp. 28-YEA-48]